MDYVTRKLKKNNYLLSEIHTKEKFQVEFFETSRHKVEEIFPQLNYVNKKLKHNKYKLSTFELIRESPSLLVKENDKEEISVDIEKSISGIPNNENIYLGKNNETAHIKQENVLSIAEDNKEDVVEKIQLHNTNDDRPTKAPLLASKKENRKKKREEKMKKKSSSRPTPNNENAKDKKKKLRPVKKKFSIFEEVIDEEKLLEERVNNQINSDNYYDNILAIDLVGSNTLKQKKKDKKKYTAIVIASIILVILIALLIGLLSIII